MLLKLRSRSRRFSSLPCEFLSCSSSVAACSSKASIWLLTPARLLWSSPISPASVAISASRFPRSFSKRSRSAFSRLTSAASSSWRPWSSSRLLLKLRSRSPRPCNRPFASLSVSSNLAVSSSSASAWCFRSLRLARCSPISSRNTVASLASCSVLISWLRISASRLPSLASCS